MPQEWESQILHRATEKERLRPHSVNEPDQCSVSTRFVSQGVRYSDGQSRTESDHTRNLAVRLKQEECLKVSDPEPSPLHMPPKYRRHFSFLPSGRQKNKTAA